MRLQSKGIFGLPGVDGSIRESSLIVIIAASRVALSGHSTYQDATVSSAVAWSARRKSVKAQHDAPLCRCSPCPEIKPAA